MFDYNEQQESGSEPKSDKAESKGQQPAAHDESSSSSCGTGRALSWERCSCDGGADEFTEEFTGEACPTSSSSSTDFGYSRPSDPTYTETVFAEQSGLAGSSAPVAADINANERVALWESLVRSQRPQSGGGTLRLPEVVARNPMQWTLVDLTASACDKPGCNPETCDAEDCGTTDAYDRSEYEQVEYASSSFVPAMGFNTGEPAAAPVAYIPTPDAPKAETGKAKKSAAKAPKAAKVKKAVKATKAGAKKAAAKKTAAKKTVKKAGAKKTAKKATTTRAKKSAATKTSLPMPPSSDPHFPRVQAA